MSDNEIGVKVTADTTDIKTGMAGSVTAVDEATARIGLDFEAMQAQCTAAVNGMQAEIQGSFTRIKTAMSTVTNAIAGIGLVLAGGAVFKEAVSATTEWTGEAIKLSKSLGITTEQASVLNVALGQTRNSVDSAAVASKMITKELRTSEEAFGALGVATRGQNGEYRSGYAVMMDVNTALSKIKNQTEQNIEGQKIYGRQWEEVRGLLRLTASAYDHASQTAKDYGMIVGVDAVKQLTAFKTSQAEVKEMLNAVKVMTGNVVMPALTELGRWFGSIGPQAVEAFGAALKAIVTGLEYVGLGAITLWETLKVVGLRIGTWAAGVADVMTNVMQFNASGAKAAGERMWTELEGIGNNYFKNMEAASRKTNESVFKLWGVGGKGASGGKFEAPGGGKGDGQKGAGGGSGKDKGDKSRFEIWRNQFEQWKEKQNDYFKSYEADELRYWQTALQLTRNGSKEQMQVQHEIYQLKSKLAHEARDDEQAQEADAAKRSKMEIEKRLEVSTILLEQEKHKIQSLKSMGMISDREEIDRLKDLEEKEYEIKRAALTEEIALQHDGSIEQLQIMNKLAVAEAKHVSAMKNLNSQAASDTAKQWQTVFHGMSNSLEQAFKSMKKGTLSFRNVWKTLAHNMVNVYGDALKKILQKQLANIAASVSATIAGEEAKTDAQQQASSKSMAMNLVNALKEISTSAAKAAAGVYSSVSSMPYVGWILGPIAAAAAFAGVMAFGAMASAEGGYEIPAGVNPVTQLHQNEMVLPADLATGMKNIIRGGGAGSDGGMGGGVHHHYAVTINAADAKSVKRLFSSNSGALAQAIGKHVRNSGKPLPV